MLRLSPAALPYSNVLLALLVAIELILNMVKLNEVKGIQFYEVFFAPFASFAILLGVFYYVLQMRHALNRLHKLLLAWMGTELLLISLFNIIFMALPNNMRMSQNVVLTIELMRFIWIVIVKAYIYRQTIEIKKLGSYLLTLGTLISANLPYQFILLNYIQMPQS